MEHPEAKSFKQLTISVEKLPASMARQEEINRYAAERARLLFGCFRTGDANDAETFVAVVTAILSRYPEEVITAVTHPVSGLPVQCSWVPTAKEVKDACEAAVLPIRSQQEREKRIAEQMRLRREEDESRATKPSYAQLKAKYGDDWGITQPKAAVDPEDEKRAKQRTERAILAEYAARGIEPRYTKAGELISLSLARQIAGKQELADHIDGGFSPGSI